MSTTTTIEPKKESLGISAALILSLVGLTLLLVIAVLIKREIRRGNVKSKRDGHFLSCKFFQRYTQSKSTKEPRILTKVKPQWLLVGHHELPKHYYTKDECPQYIARMFTIDLYTVLQYTCREIFPVIQTSESVESFFRREHPTLYDTLNRFERLKIRAEADFVPFTLDETRKAVNVFNEFLQKLSEIEENPYVRQRQVDMTVVDQSEEQEVKMSSRYIPVLPKDLCHRPLRAVDEDSLGDINKRSRSKGRFPFHLPSFLNKRKFFSTKSSSASTQASKNRDDPQTTTESPMEEYQNDNDTPVDNSTNKQSRQRIKRQGATDAVPLVEYHDAISHSTTFGSDIGYNS